MVMTGFDTKAMRQIVKLRKMESADREEPTTTNASPAPRRRHLSDWRRLDEKFMRSGDNATHTTESTQPSFSSPPSPTSPTPSSGSPVTPPSASPTV